MSKFAVVRLVQAHNSCSLGKMSCYVHKIVYVFFLWCCCSHAFRLGDTIASVSTTRQSTNKTVKMNEGVSFGTDGIILNKDVKGSRSKF